MKQVNIFSKNNIVRDTFKEVSEFMDTPDFEDQIRELVKSMKIPEVFQMNSDILGVKKEESTKGENIFSEKSWLNLVDFLKVQLKLYEESNNKQSVQDYIKETFITDGHCSYVKVTDRNILNFILKNNTDDYFNNILKENLRASKLSGKQLVYLTIYQPDFYIDGYSNLDDTHKKSMIRNILFDWSNDEFFTSRDLDINFIKNYFTDEEIFIAFKSRTKEILEAISSESTHPHFYDHNLIKLENGNYICVEDSSEPTSSDFSESQLSELKSEFIPILEKIQDVILVDYKGGNNKYILESIINPTLTKDKKIKVYLKILNTVIF